MAKPKIGEFTTDEIYLSDVAKAFSHPARIRIMKILTEMDICMCGEIVDQLPLAQATVSQHLKELKRVGLIQGDIYGPKVCYCVHPENLIKAKKEIENIFSHLTKKGALTCRTKKK
jgi:predicted transcriptional regulator